VLFHCPAFRQRVAAVDADGDLIISELQAVFRELSTSPDDCSANSLFSALHLQSSDAVDAWFALVGKMDDGPFFHTSVRSTRSWNGGSEGTTEPPDPLIIVFAGANRSLQEAVLGFMKSEPLDGYCVEGQITKVMITREIVNVPDVLAIQLSRYGVGGSRAWDTIVVDEILNVPVGKNAIKTRLHAVVMHGGGHYAALVRVGPQWLEISDTSFERVEHQVALTRAGILGYLFFYARLDTEQRTFGETG
jgi:hypothetical protein